MTGGFCEEAGSQFQGFPVDVTVAKASTELAEGWKSESVTEAKGHQLEEMGIHV